MCVRAREDEWEYFNEMMVGRSVGRSVGRCRSPVCFVADDGGTASAAKGNVEVVCEMDQTTDAVVARMDQTTDEVACVAVFCVYFCKVM